MSRFQIQTIEKTNIKIQITGKRCHAEITQKQNEANSTEVKIAKDNSESPGLKNIITLPFLVDYTGIEKGCVAKIMCHHYGWIQRSKIQSGNWNIIVPANKQKTH